MHTHGDFVIQRKEGLIAYQLAVVVDDYLQGVTRVVRGSDLLDSTVKQLFLYSQLGFTHPQYTHIPILVNQQQQKLSKQNFAPALDQRRPLTNLLKALRFLNQPLPSVAPQSCAGLLAWSTQHWQPTLIPPILQKASDD